MMPCRASSSDLLDSMPEHSGKLLPSYELWRIPIWLRPWHAPTMTQHPPMGPPLSELAQIEARVARPTAQYLHPGLSGIHCRSAMLSQHPLEIPPPLSELVQTEKRVALPTAQTHTARQLRAVTACDVCPSSFRLASTYLSTPIWCSSLFLVPYAEHLKHSREGRQDILGRVCRM